MVMEMQSQELQQMHFLRQLAACVKRIQWIYAIFWSKSSRVGRSLEWNDGYYNGDIKTRKMTQETECRADEMGLQRSEELRELYESLCIGDCNQQTRPTASLSPEDLTDKEWYYLVCMSFTFNFGQDLPGKAYERNEPIWLNNAQFAENSCFCRSLLAKSASIQTVVCLPFMDGVLELGTTELVMEEPGFLHNITSSLWELQLPCFSEHSTSNSPLERKEDDDVCLISNHEVQGMITSENCALIMENDSHFFPFSVESYALDIDNELIHYKEIIGVPEHRSNDPDEPSQVHIRQLMAEEFSDGLNSSMNFSECISPQNILCSLKGERLKDNVFNHSREDDHSEFCSLGIEDDGSHYFSTLSAILGDLKQGRSSPGFSFQNRLIDSSFRVWEKSSKSSKVFIRFPQRMLKKILFGRNWINGGEWANSHEENVPRNKAFKAEADDANSNHALSERRRREKLNEKFVTLRSLVPSISKVDKASILADTIEYLKDLEKRVEELEFCRAEMDTNIRERRKHPDITERTSDNYGKNEFIIPQKSLSNKRKACEMDDSEAQLNLILPNNGLFDINVTMIDREVFIELHCPWRDFLLLDIIEALCNLRLDPHSVRSSTGDPATVIALRAKIMSKTDTSPGMIKRSLQRVIGEGRINL